MPFKIVRNDITKMNTDIIVNTANEKVIVGTGCDHAIYTAAGFQELLKYREEYIGELEEGEVFITPPFKLGCKYIVHAVSPKYIDGESGEETKLRHCYSESLAMAVTYNAKSIAFPLIGTGRYAYPIEEGIRIAIDEINAFLLKNDMMVYLVVFDKQATELGNKIYSELESYIDANYVKDRFEEEYKEIINSSEKVIKRISDDLKKIDKTDSYYEQIEKMESSLADKISEASEKFSDYLMYLIKSKGLDNAQVYNASYVNKKLFSKIKTNSDYHPQKLTALCLCIGAHLTMQESRNLLARAGYTFSPCDKTDIIFSYFIENGIYDIIEIDIQLEAHGLPHIIYSE